MIGQITAIRSSFPSAFIALGVGTIFFLFALAFYSLTAHKLDQIIVDRSFIPADIRPAISFILAFSCFFFIYVCGFALIAISTRAAYHKKSFEVNHLEIVFSLNNESLTKYYFEQKSLVDAFSGLGLTFLFGFFVFSAGLVYRSNDLYIESILSLVLGIVLARTFWAESTDRIKRIDALLTKLQKD